MKHTHTVIPQVLNWLFLGLLIIVVVCPGGDGPSVPPSGGGAAGDAQGRPMTRLWVANNPGAGQMQPGSSMMIPGMQMQGGAGQPGMGQPGMVQPGMGQPGMAQPGMGQPGMVQPGMGQPGMAQPGMGQQMVPGPSGQTQGFILVLPQPPPPPATPSTSTAPSPSPPEDELYKLNQGNNGQLSQTIDVIKKKILAMKREVDLKWKANMRNNLPQDCPQVQKLLAEKIKLEGLLKEMIQKWPRMSHHLDKQSVRKILRSVNIFLKRKTNVKVKSGKGKDKGKKQKKKKESKNL